MKLVVDGWVGVSDSCSARSATPRETIPLAFEAAPTGLVVLGWDPGRCSPSRFALGLGLRLPLWGAGQLFRLRVLHDLL